MDQVDLVIEQFACPRCHREVDERLYGPCVSCREELRASMGRAPTDMVAAGAFVPKMNVVPNQIATKE